MAALSSRYTHTIRAVTCVGGVAQNPIYDLLSHGSVRNSNANSTESCNPLISGAPVATFISHASSPAYNPHRLPTHPGTPRTSSRLQRVGGTGRLRGGRRVGVRADTGGEVLERLLAGVRRGARAAAGTQPDHDAQQHHNFGGTLLSGGSCDHSAGCSLTALDHQVAPQDSQSAPAFPMRSIAARLLFLEWLQIHYTKL